MHNLYRDSFVILLSAICSALITGFILNHIFHHKRKTIFFWLISSLGFVVVASSVLIYFSGPSMKILSFSVLTLACILLFVSTLTLTIRNKRRERDENIIKDGSGFDGLRHPSKKSLISLSIVLAMCFVLLTSDFCAIIPDIPDIVTEHYSILKGDLGSWDSNDNIIGFFVNTSNDDFFMISAKDFNLAKKGTVYTVKYFPHSKYVVDILDQNGKSLLR